MGKVLATTFRRVTAGTQCPWTALSTIPLTVALAVVPEKSGTPKGFGRNLKVESGIP